MNKKEVVKIVLGERLTAAPANHSATAFAPTNIALCKYWGKRNTELNLPVTSSLSVSLGNKGATVTLKVSDDSQDSIIVNDHPVALHSSFAQRLIEFLNLFRQENTLRFAVTIQSSIPIAAGMASSACGFASVVQALNQLYDWQLSTRELSLLARLGSGSACRSLWSGFVEWHAGVREDGMDSGGELLEAVWPELCVGLLIVSDKEKGVSSRVAMQRTVESSALYSAWPTKVSQDLAQVKEAIRLQDFDLLGKTAESNALAMHATLLSAWPPMTYCLPDTLLAMRHIWQLRQEGLALYFTQDAGPNLKLLFLQHEKDQVLQRFPNVDVVHPFHNE